MQGASDPLLVYVFLVVQFLSSQHEGLRAIVEKFHRRYVSPMNILVIAVGDEAEYLPHAAGVTSEFDHPAGVRRKQFIPCDPSIAFLLLVFIGSRGYGCEVLLNEPLLGRRGRAGFATVTDSDDFIREVEDCPEDGSALCDITRVGKDKGGPDAADHTHGFADTKSTLRLFTKCPL